MICCKFAKIRCNGARFTCRFGINVRVNHQCIRKLQIKCTAFKRNAIKIVIKLAVKIQATPAMSSYRHKSGAQKRQGKKERELEVKRDSRTLFEVGAFRRERDQETSIESEESSVQSVSTEKEDTQDLAISTSHDIAEYEAEITTESSLNQDVLPNQSESSVIELYTACSGSCSFDVGTLARSPTMKELENIVRTGHLPHPREFPKDCGGHKFPTTFLSVK